MTKANAASYRRVDSFSASPAIKQRAKKRRSSTPAKPSLAALAALRRLRAEAEAEIDRLIAFLDSTETDHDLEENGDHEPNNGHMGSFFDEAEEDRSDEEPTLGWPDHTAHGQGMLGSTTDEEIGQFVEKPKRTHRINREPITVDCSYRRFVHGITPAQKALMAPRVDHKSWVVLR